MLTIDKQELAGTTAHRETLEKLKKVVEDAHALLQKQFTRSGYLTKMMSSSSVADQFAEIDARLANQMGAMTLSVGVLNLQNSGGGLHRRRSQSEAEARAEAEANACTGADTSSSAESTACGQRRRVLRSWRKRSLGCNGGVVRFPRNGKA